MPRFILAVLGALLVLSACGGGDEGPVGLAVGDSEFGEILVDGDGRTLYFLLTDRQNNSTCLNECELIWTPLRQEDLGGIGDGINEAWVSNITRNDGVIQVTYNGWPLYKYRDDSEPGDMNGHGALNAWFALGPNGGAVGVTE